MRQEKNMNTKDNNEYCLNNIDNYKHDLSCSLQEILVKLVSVIIEYVRFISEKIIMKNKEYYCFIFERGLYSIIHVFSIIFYHTNNLDLTIYHCQKAYYFYIEFIEQIADDNVTFLKLSSKDAVMFVYKRTIFEINNDVRRKQKKTSEDMTKIYSQLNLYIGFYKKLFSSLINCPDFDYTNKDIWLNKNIIYTQDIAVYLNKIKLKPLQLECLNIFCNILDQDKLSFISIYDLIMAFVRALPSKKTITMQKNIIKKMTDTSINTYIEENTYDNLINYIFSDDIAASC